MSKKFIFSSMLMLLSLMSYGQQDYHPLLKEGKVWNSVLTQVRIAYEGAYRKTEDISYIVGSDTIINGKAYKKLFRRMEGEDKYYCALREENKQVWMHVGKDYWDILREYEEEWLLYDFGLNTGERYIIGNRDSYYYSEVELVSSIQINSHGNDLILRRYKDTFYYADSNLISIVEGVGCREGWNMTLLFCEIPSGGSDSNDPTGYSYEYESFLSCYEDGQCIFTVEDFNNPGTSYIHTDVTDNKPSTFFDLQGRRLTDKPSQPGIYIQDGRKYVVK